jgi:superfamily II DNA or RNA helicase
MKETGTIYLRDNAWYKMENVIKMGIASFAKDRNNTYITGEVERGEYICVIEIPLDKMKILDKVFKSYFKEYNIYKGGGTEFYNRCITELIEPYLKKINIEYKILTSDEILLMNRCERIKNMQNINKIKNIINKVNVCEFINKLKANKIKINTLNQTPDLIHIVPNIQQQHVLNIITDFYNINNVGKLIWACGLGKALLSILIIQLLKFKSIIIGVPNTNLQKQMAKEILKVFPNKNNILLVGGDKDEIKTTTNIDIIISFLNTLTNTTHATSNNVKFIITTYHSCYVLLDERINVNFKIGDEAHHLVGIEKEEYKGFRLFHKISSNKTLFMTATEKIIDKSAHNIYSMDDEKVFGPYIDIKSVHWAIENKKITDYNILVIKNTENEVDNIINQLKLSVYDKNLFISCYMCLKSFERYDNLTHILLYTNNTNDAELANTYINDLLLNINFNTEYMQYQHNKLLYNNALHSKNCKNFEEEIAKFKNAKYGIISCVYIFGEGFDLPKLNGVCIAANMQSETRIVQYALRPNRLNREDPHKKAYIIIPYIDADDWDTKNNSFEKVRNIISQMRNIDDKIEQKITLQMLTEIKEEKHTESDTEIDTSTDKYNLIDNGDELNKIKLRLRYSKALGSRFTEEQDEYNYIRSINISLNITSKQEYINSKYTHYNYIESPEQYFKKKGVWINWYDFIGTDITKFIKSKCEWINFCKENGVNSLQSYNTLCNIYNILPKEPDEFYSNFSNIPLELGFNTIRRR